jgi:hypothetical protein
MSAAQAPGGGARHPSDREWPPGDQAESRAVSTAPTGAQADRDTASPQYAAELPSDGPLLYTLEQAARMLQVRPSLLARRAAARAVPCTFLGKHLRFSRPDLDAIIAAASQGPPQDATARRVRRT